MRLGEVEGKAAGHAAVGEQRPRAHHASMSNEVSKSLDRILVSSERSGRQGHKQLVEETVERNVWSSPARGTSCRRAVLGRERAARPHIQRDAGAEAAVREVGRIDRDGANPAVAEVGELV
jgi:hypothetical protein